MVFVDKKPNIHLVESETNAYLVPLKMKKIGKPDKTYNGTKIEHYPKVTYLVCVLDVTLFGDLRIL